MCIQSGSTFPEDLRLDYWFCSFLRKSICVVKRDGIMRVLGFVEHGVRAQFCAYPLMGTKNIFEHRLHLRKIEHIFLDGVELIDLTLI